MAQAERPELFQKKLAVCAVVYDFRVETETEAKEDKRQSLLELIDFVNVKKSITEPMYKDTIEMVRAPPAPPQNRWWLDVRRREAHLAGAALQIKTNLFRPLPPGQRDFNPNFDAEEDEPFLEPAWPHLQLVYEFFLRFIVSSDVDPKVAKRYIDKASIISMLELFDSEDPRERDYLKTILHRVYGKFMSHRPFIRRAINNTFYRFIYERDYHNGISELLEILGSIINGFALPLKEEHKTFLVKALIPLHKPKNINAFQQQLSYCTPNLLPFPFFLTRARILVRPKIWRSSVCCGLCRRDAVRGEGRGAGGDGDPRPAAVLADHQLGQVRAVPRRARGAAGADAAPGVPEHLRTALPHHLALPHVAPLPGPLLVPPALSLPSLLFCPVETCPLYTSKRCRFKRCWLSSDSHGCRVVCRRWRSARCSCGTTSTSCSRSPTSSRRSSRSSSSRSPRTPRATGTRRCTASPTTCRSCSWCVLHNRTHPSTLPFPLCGAVTPLSVPRRAVVV